MLKTKYFSTINPTTFTDGICNSQSYDLPKSISDNSVTLNSKYEGGRTMSYAQPTKKQSDFAKDIHWLLGYPLPEATRKKYGRYIERYKNEFLEEKKKVFKGKRSKELQLQLLEKVRQNGGPATRLQRAFVYEIAKSFEIPLPELTVCDSYIFIELHEKNFYAKRDAEIRKAMWREFWEELSQTT